MSSSSVTGGSESRGTVTVEQLVGECFIKTAQTVLSSRVYEPPSLISKQQQAKRSAWFKLELQELESARPALDKWRAERGVGLPLILEIYLHPSCNVLSEEVPPTLVERWLIHYAPSDAMPLPISAGGLSRSQMARYNPQAVYKRLTLLIRSVYSYCRVLPAYRLYRTARGSHRSPPFRLGYRLHSTLPSRGDPISARMQRFEFSPVDTADGQLKLTVEYQPASTVRVLGQAAIRVPRPAIIPDYVRSMEPSTSAAGHIASSSPSSPQTPAVPTINTAAAAAAAAAAAGAAGSGLASTPRRRGWSSSFRLSPARSYEPPPPLSPGASPSPAPSTSGAFAYQLPQPINSLGIAPAGVVAQQQQHPVLTTRGEGTSGSFPRSSSMPARSAMPSRPPLPPGALQSAAPGQGQGQSFDPGFVGPAVPPGAAGDGGVSAAAGKGSGGEGRNPLIAGSSSEDDEESDTEFGGGGGGVLDGQDEQLLERGATSAAAHHRRASPPVKIPGVSAAHRRNLSRPAGLKSSGDLGALVGEGGVTVATGSGAASRYSTQKPLSAPALSHMRLGSSPTENETETENDTSEGGILFEPLTAGVQGEIQPTKITSTSGAAVRGAGHEAHSVESGGSSAVPVPPTPLGDAPEIPHPAPRLHPPSFSESVTSSTAPFPTSFSPDFPFAFTPSARYSPCSPGSIGIGPSGGSSGGGFLAAAGAVPSHGTTLPHHPSSSPALINKNSASAAAAAAGGGGRGTGGVLGDHLPSAAGSSSPQHHHSVLSNLRRVTTTPPSPRGDLLALTGREISAGTALMRRASWGARSFTTENFGGGGAAVPLVGYSVSPLQESGVLESLLSGSTPRHLLQVGSGYTGRLTHASSAVSELAGRSMAGGDGTGTGTGNSSGRKDQQLLLTFPAGHAAQQQQQHGVETVRNVPGGGRMAYIPREDSEQLPFDFTADGSDQSDESMSGDGGGGGGEGAHSSGSTFSAFASPRLPGAVFGEAGGLGGGEGRLGGYTEGGNGGGGKNGTAIGTTATATATGTAGSMMNDGRSTPPPPPAFDMASSAAAVGAFMRLVREAQPLSGLGSVPFASGVEQLDALRTRLQEQGVE